MESLFDTQTLVGRPACPDSLVKKNVFSQPVCLQARVQRLASELQSSTMRAELLAAKGAMYDELKAQADKLQQDNQRLQVGLEFSLHVGWWSSSLAM